MTYQPIAVRRSRGLHYYQAWSPKLRRRIALYSRSSLAVWLLLEASPDIDTFCERPGFIPHRFGAELPDGGPGARYSPCPHRLFY